MSTLVTDFIADNNKKLAKAIHGFIRMYFPKVPMDIRVLCASFAFTHSSEINDFFDESAISITDLRQIKQPLKESNYMVSRDEIEVRWFSGYKFEIPMGYTFPAKWICRWKFVIVHRGVGNVSFVIKGADGIRSWSHGIHLRYYSSTPYLNGISLWDTFTPVEIMVNMVNGSYTYSVANHPVIMDLDQLLDYSMSIECYNALSTITVRLKEFSVEFE